MSSDTFMYDSYVRQYCNVSTEVSKGIKQYQNLSGDERDVKIRDVERRIKEADSVLKKMRLEVNNLSTASAAKCEQSLNEYTADLSSLKKQHSEAKAQNMTGDSARRELGLDGSGSSLYQQQRNSMLTTTQRAQQGLEQLEQGTRMLDETEELGVGILQDLHRQREVITGAGDRLSRVDDKLGKARKVLATMSRRITQNKLILGAIIAVLVIAIGFVVYKMFQ